MALLTVHTDAIYLRGVADVSELNSWRCVGFWKVIYNHRLQVCLDLKGI